MPQVIKPTKQIVGVEPAVGSEWDAGWLPTGYVHRAIRVSVRKDANERWTIYALSSKGSEVLEKREILSLPCECCAKAFALSILYGKDYAQCYEHAHSVITEGALFDATLLLLQCALGLGVEWEMIEDEGAKQRVMWTARELLEGVQEWGKVLGAWEFVQNLYPHASTSTLLRLWFNEISFHRK